MIDVVGKLWSVGANKGGFKINNSIDDPYGTMQSIQLNACGSINKNLVCKFIANKTFHAVAIDENSDLWVVGQNQCGQLGLKNNRRSPIFKKVPNINQCSLVACGLNHTIVLDNKGIIWGTGNNIYGQLGLQGYRNTNVFTKISTTTFISISCGDYHTIALDSSGYIWSTGDNTYGQLSILNTTAFKTNTCDFNKIEKKVLFKFITCGSYSTMAIDENGSVWSTGYNKCGQLGLNTYDDMFDLTNIESEENFILASCGHNHSLLLDINGFIWLSGKTACNKYENFKNFRKINDNKFVHIACGLSHITAIDCDGYVWSDNINFNYNLKNGSFQKVLEDNKNIVQLTGGPMKKCRLKPARHNSY